MTSHPSRTNWLNWANPNITPSEFESVKMGCLLSWKYMQSQGQVDRVSQHEAMSKLKWQKSREGRISLCISKEHETERSDRNQTTPGSNWWFLTVLFYPQWPSIFPDLAGNIHDVACSFIYINIFICDHLSGFLFLETKQPWLRQAASQSTYLS